MAAPGARQHDGGMSDHPASQQRGLDGFFAWLRGTGIRRDTDNKWLAGVCSGMARRLGVDPVLLRGGLLLLIVFGGFGLLLYLIAWALLPGPDGDILAEKGVRHGDARAIMLLVAIGIGVLGELSDRTWLWTVLLPIGLFVWWTLRSRGRSSGVPWGHPSTDPTAAYAVGPAPGSVPPGAAPHPMGPGRTGAVTGAVRHTPTRRPRAGLLGLLLTAGLAVAAYGGGTLLATDQAWASDPQVIGLTCALGAAGAGLILIGLAGRRAGFTGFLVTALAVATVAVPAGAPGVVRSGVGDRAWVASAQPDGGFRLGAGDATLHLDGATANQVITVAQGLGNLTIYVPPGVRATTTARVGAGQLSMTRDGRTVEAGAGVGTDAEKPFVVGAGATAVTLNVDLGLGDLTIIEEAP